MGIFDDLFGGFFDVNGDGHTDFGEELMGYMFLSDLEKEERLDDDDIL